METLSIVKQWKASFVNIGDYLFILGFFNPTFIMFINNSRQRTYLLPLPPPIFPTKGEGCLELCIRLPLLSSTTSVVLGYYSSQLRYLKDRIRLYWGEKPHILPHKPF